VRAATDREAFGLLYDRWFDRIYGYCHRRLQTHAAAEDATSQTFLKALAGITSYRPDAVPFRAWLFTIAHNVVVDVYRRGRPTAPLDDAPDIPARETGPEEQALALETQREVHALLDRLTDDQADVIRLRLAGLPVETDDEDLVTLARRLHATTTIARERPGFRQDLRDTLMQSPSIAFPVPGRVPERRVDLPLA